MPFVSANVRIKYSFEKRVAHPFKFSFPLNKNCVPQSNKEKSINHQFEMINLKHRANLFFIHLLA